MEHLLKEKIVQVPTAPGVYQFFNKNGDILYIGKAKNLRNRIRSYFQNSDKQTSKNTTMINHVCNFEWIVLRSEVEALLTEANLIKVNSPRYNILMKDDKTFPYIRITNEPYPQVLLTRKVIKDGSKYFGPFTDARSLRIILKVLHKVFPIRSCSYFIDENTIKNKTIKICLDYHIKKCEGPCEGLVTKIKYNDMIKQVIQFIKGDTAEIKRNIEKAINILSKKLRFEEAIIYRDQLNAINSFKERQVKITSDFTNRDVIAFATKNHIGIAIIFRIRMGRILSREKITLKNADYRKSQIMKSVITNFYMNSDLMPDEISLSVIPSDEQDLKIWLKDKNNRVIKLQYPKKGDKAKEIRIVEQNAELLLGEWIIRRKKRKEQVPKILNKLQNDLNLDIPPRRIEAFDVSHLGGTNTVGAMVHFFDGKPVKKQYRKFKIKTVSGIDDFSSIREIVKRRYSRLKNENQTFPDLILIDGGKGQLNMAFSALRELGLDYIPIIGLAKRLEEVFILGNSQPQNIDKQSPGLLLLRKIRDEVHRFAIKYQRQKRIKKTMNSEYLNIPGMGQKRLQILFNNFDGPQTISKNNPEQIRDATGIPLDICEKIFLVSKSI